MVLRGNQYVKLKVKIPTKLTPKQIELIQEFDKAGSTSSTATDSKANSSTNNSGEECKQTFNIQEAWKRLKSFMGTTEKDASSSSDKDSATEEEISKKSAKAKAA